MDLGNRSVIKSSLCWGRANPCPAGSLLQPRARARLVCGFRWCRGFDLKHGSAVSHVYITPSHLFGLSFICLLHTLRVTFLGWHLKYVVISGSNVALGVWPEVAPTTSHRCDVEKCLYVEWKSSCNNKDTKSVSNMFGAIGPFYRVPSKQRAVSQLCVWVRQAERTDNTWGFRQIPLPRHAWTDVNLGDRRL